LKDEFDAIIAYFYGHSNICTHGSQTLGNHPTIKQKKP